jgi:molybdenum cofactor cytidylyltransferase
LDDVILVLGHEAERAGAAVGELGQQVVVNPRYAEGLSTSVAAGLAAVDQDADAVLFLLGDQPTVGPAAIDAVVGRFVETRAPIVMPSYGGIPANPVLFARELFSELREVGGDEGARSIIRRHREQVAYAAVDVADVPRDVDTEEDYEALLSSLTNDVATLPSPAHRERGLG